MGLETPRTACNAHSVLTRTLIGKRPVYGCAVLGLFVLCLTSGCSRNDYSKIGPRPPVITGIDVYDQPAVPGASFTTAVAAYSPLGLPLTYRWTTTDGWTISGGANDAVVTITAPGSYRARGTAYVTVSDTNGTSAEGSAGMSTFSEPLIVFVSARGGDYSIYRMEEDGTAVTRLSDPSTDCVLNQCFDTYPSACRGDISFSSNRTGRFQLYSMSVYGKQLTQLTNSANADLDAPDYSYDCTVLCYTVAQDAKRQIACMNLRTSSVSQITYDDGSGACCGKFSPDDRTIAYIHDPFPSAATAGVEAPMSIYTVSPDGSNRHWLCNTSNVYPPLSWSPDGKEILFLEPSSTTGHLQIFSMPVDCSTPPSALTDPSYDVFDPAFSADGSRIAYVSTQLGNSRIFLMNADGSSSTDITEDVHLNDQPIWQKGILLTP